MWKPADGTHPGFWNHLWGQNKEPNPKAMKTKMVSVSEENVPLTMSHL